MQVSSSLAGSTYDQILGWTSLRRNTEITNNEIQRGDQSLIFNFKIGEKVEGI